MATPILQRLLNALPTNWVPTGMVDENGRTYRIAGQMSGTAAVYQGVQNQIDFLKAQTRISSSTGGFLDMSSRDFFGTKWPRKAGESDTAYSARLLTKFFQPQGTYEAMVSALQALTGNTPTIIRPRRPFDVGAYAQGGRPVVSGSQSVRRGYSTAGAYGSLLMPYQAGISIKRPSVGSISGRAGYATLTGRTATQNSGAGGYASLTGKTAAQNRGGYLAYSSLSEMTGGVSDQDIYNTVLATKLEGTLVWVQITD